MLVYLSVVITSAVPVLMDDFGRIPFMLLVAIDELLFFARLIFCFYLISLTLIFSVTLVKLFSAKFLPGSENSLLS